MIKKGLDKRNSKYSEYKLEDSILINGSLVDNIFISHHYKENHGNYINDEMILALIKQLHNNKFDRHRKGELEKTIIWSTYKKEPLWFNNKAYKIIWYTESNDKNSLLVLNCYRRSKHEK